MSTALQLAEKIASKSPVAVLGSKVNLNYSRDHTVQEGLDFAVSVPIPYQQVFILHCRWYGTRPCYSRRMWAWQFQHPSKKKRQFSLNSNLYVLVLCSAVNSFTGDWFRGVAKI